MNEFGFLPNSTMIELFCSFFGRIRGQQKVLSKLTDLQMKKISDYCIWISVCNKCFPLYLTVLIINFFAFFQNHGDDLKCNWPTIITIITRDQYGEVVQVPELKVEVNAVPIEEINQSVTRLRKMAAPGIKTILELQVQKM